MAGEDRQDSGGRGLKRVVLVGPSGSGKTPLGRWISATLGHAFTDLDDLYRRPGWQPAVPEDICAAGKRATRADRWVLAGNYEAVRHIVWPRADTLIWLDLALPLALWRSTRRAVRDAITGRPICNGNRQTLRLIVNGGDSLIGHTLRTHSARRRTWPALVASQPRLTLIRLRTPAAVAAWQREVQPH